MIDTLLDALIDSLKVLGCAFVIYVIISFIEHKIARALDKGSKLSPLAGSALGLIPQCGIGVVAGDLYLKQHISMGTVIAVFLACSDEAVPILFTSLDGIKTILPLLLIKFVIGFVVGFTVDLFERKNKVVLSYHHEHCEHHLDTEIHVGCCGHAIEDDVKEPWAKKHLLHPLIHSLKIFLYVLGINITIGLIIYFIGGEDTLASLFNGTKYISPVIAGLIGIIPNCAASVVITSLYIDQAITFGACVSGLCMNAGLGLLFLFKSKENFKNNIKVFIIMITTSIAFGYLTDLVLLLIK